MLLPPSGERIESLSNDVREAIAAVVEAVGSSTSSPNTPTMATRVAAVVTAVRNLLYVSGTLTTPSSNLHLSSRLVEEESSRQPLTELKPHQRKVTATLSKLVLSARAAASNPDWPYDDATTRVDSDASELETAVVKFVMEVKRLEVMAGVILTEKRLEGVLVSGEGLAGVGTMIYGAGSAAEWRGLGFVPPEPEEGRVAPQWPLGEDVLAELKSYKAIIEDGLDTICDSDSSMWI
jgi:son of sevenless-like protein